MDLDRVTSRRFTDSYKWDDNERLFGRSELLPFWVADMDFETPAPILDAIRKRTEHPILGYERRSEEYLDAVLGWLSSRHDWEIPREWLMFCPPGSILGMYGLVNTLTSPGDSIALQTPTYSPLYDIVAENGRRQILSPLRELGGRFVFDPADMEFRLDADTKMIILCSPHNPTGRVFTEEELAPLAAFVEERDLIVVSDEVHCDLVMPGHRHIPYGKFGGDRSVTVISPNKTFNTAGIPQATLIIPNKAIRDKFSHFLAVTQLNHDPTYGAAGMRAAYQQCGDWLDEVIEYVAGNHKRVAEYLDNYVPVIKKVEAEATYLAWLDFRATGLSEPESMAALVNKGGVGLYAGTEFGAAGEGFFRMNLACPRNTLEKGLAGIRKAFA